jgi:hypothetical protein
MTIDCHTNVTIREFSTGASAAPSPHRVIRIVYSIAISRTSVCKDVILARPLAVAVRGPPTLDARPMALKKCGWSSTTKRDFTAGIAQLRSGKLVVRHPVHSSRKSQLYDTLRIRLTGSSEQGKTSFVLHVRSEITIGACMS